mmetsp:Transcript_33616/g.51795  ORF Transcript_33616/g.51795 Transcript_33616/m.51795 type:complete len:94 (-) Transcript_33616:3866-4147(-)
MKEEGSPPQQKQHKRRQTQFVTFKKSNALQPKMVSQGGRRKSFELNTSSPKKKAKAEKLSPYKESKITKQKTMVTRNPERVIVPLYSVAEDQG